MEILTQEVKTMKELQEQIQDNPEIAKEYEVAVIVYTFDKDNRIIFQRRGPGCRDERLKLETIGGRVKQSDSDFRQALTREIKEEVGDQAQIIIEEFITGTYAKTYDDRYGKEQAWIYILYKGRLESGTLQIAEPTKCLGYERYKIGEVDENELSNGSRELYKIVSKKYSYLK